METCSANGCTKPLFTRKSGLCSKHYYRMSTWGSVEDRPRCAGTPSERFWRFVTKLGDTSDACWNWGGRIRPDGYGQFNGPDKGTFLAHRWGYEDRVAPIPEGLELDHLCRNRACVRPSHLEPVSKFENLTRSPLSTVTRYGQRTHCNKGHEFTPENTLIRRGRNESGRRCKTCNNERSRQNRLKNKAGGLDQRVLGQGRLIRELARMED